MNIELNALIREVVARHGGSVREVVPIVGNGSVNDVFVATTEHGQFVVRINADRGLDEFRKEAWCIQQAAARDVLGPTVLELGQWDDCSYMVQSFLVGSISSEETIDRVATWRAIGQYARAIHSIQDYGFGLDLRDIQDRCFEERWRKHVTYNITCLAPKDTLIGLGALTSNQSPRVHALFQDLLDMRFTFGLNHGDLSLKNVLVGAQGEVYLLDWGCAEAHVVPHHDIGEILKSSLGRHSAEFGAFLDGYGFSADGYQQIEHDVHALLLLRAIDKLRWAIDQYPVAIPSMVDTVKMVYRLTFA